MFAPGGRWTREFDARPPPFGRTKRLLIESFGRDLPAHLAAETDATARGAHGDYERGIDAVVEKEPATFVGR